MVRAEQQRFDDAQINFNRRFIRLGRFSGRLLGVGYLAVLQLSIGRGLLVFCRHEISDIVIHANRAGGKMIEMANDQIRMTNR